MLVPLGLTITLSSGRFILLSGPGTVILPFPFGSKVTSFPVTVPGPGRVILPPGVTIVPSGTTVVSPVPLFGVTVPPFGNTTLPLGFLLG